MTDDLLNHRIRDYVKLAALRLLESGALPMDEICSHQFFLEGFLDAINLVGNPAGGSVKVSILP